MQFSLNLGVLCSSHTCQTLLRLTKRWWSRHHAFTGSGCHHVSPSSCLETTKLQKFPLPDQVFRQFASQKMGNVNQFKPADLFGPKDELWGTTLWSLFVSCFVMCKTTLIPFLCECRQVSLLVCWMGIFIPIV